MAEVWEAAQTIGFPIILKPIDGAGSADTYRVNDEGELKDVLPALRHVPHVSVEEFVDGEEYTFDTITVNGKIAYYNVAWYRPRPLVARSHEWISPQVIALCDLDRPELQDQPTARHSALGDAVDRHRPPQSDTLTDYYEALTRYRELLEQAGYLPL